MNSEDLQARADSVGFWFHSIDLGGGVITRGGKSAALLASELKELSLPDVRGKSVLDIGAWDGFYSFEAEKRGANRVVALDHFVWSTDLPKQQAYEIECKRAGTVPKRIQDTEWWRPHELPGKAGFDAAREALGSKAEAVVDNFMTMDLQTLGQFDVVFFLGVLYHMAEPMTALQRVAQLTREVAVIETHAVSVPGYEHLSLCEFYPSNELNGDVTNWWGPNLLALQGMCLAAGFRSVRIVKGPPIVPAPKRVRRFLKRSSGLQTKPQHFRAILHAYK